MPSSFTPARNYVLQATGEDVNTWGINLNFNFSIIDNNLGGTLALNVGGNSNIALTSSQAQYLIHNLTGALTGNINYQFPASGGFFAINNQTTGAHTLTVTVLGGSGGIVVAQGTTTTIYIDATVPQVEVFTGTAYVFNSGAVTGTANALVISQTFPTNFSLNNGTFITFTPTTTNTGASTLNVDGTGAINIQKIVFSGLVNVMAGDLPAGGPTLAQYNGSVWVVLNIVPVGYETTVSTNQAVGFGNCYTPYVNTVPITYTIDVSTNLASFWYVDIFAQAGQGTITINGADKLNNGSVGVGTIMPTGTSGRITTDANGNLWLNGTTVKAGIQVASQGGFINKFRNGQFDIWQRGTSGTITAGSPSYTADGWIVGSTGANVTWLQAGAGASSLYVLEVTGNTSVTDTFVRQRIESYVAAELYGSAAKTVTVQASIFNSTGGTITPTLTVKHAGSADNWGSPVTDVSAVSLQACTNSATTVVSYTFTTASGTNNGLEVTFDFGATLNTSGKSIFIGSCDIRNTQEVNTGLNSTPPPTEVRPIQTELAFCQRYFYAFNSVNTFNNIATGQCLTTNVGAIPLRIPVTMRITPTGVTVSSVGHFVVIGGANANEALASLTLFNAIPDIVYLNATTSATPLVGNNACSLVCTSASGQILVTGAEL